MTSWTNDGVIRQASLQEVRERTDKTFQAGLDQPAKDRNTDMSWRIGYWRGSVRLRTTTLEDATQDEAAQTICGVKQ